MIGMLAYWASTMGFAHMAALYLGPLAITNCWLVLYTWLQHTDVRCPKPLLPTPVLPFGTPLYL